MELEWLILADYAQVVGNKLYLMGGGWDVLTVSTAFPVVQRCAVAASFKVPWNETNERQEIEISILSDDGDSIATVRGQVEVGRPAGILPGTDQRTQIAADLGLNLGKAGTYCIVARIGELERGRVLFRVVAPGR
jgi:hypothetical protein